MFYTGMCYPDDSVDRSAAKKTPEPILIQFQQEDGSILPANQLDPDIVANTIRDTAASLPVGKFFDASFT